MRGIFVAVAVLFGLVCCAEGILPSGIDSYENYIIADVVVSSLQQGLLIEEISDSLCGSISLQNSESLWTIGSKTRVLLGNKCEFNEWKNHLVGVVDKDSVSLVTANAREYWASILEEDNQKMKRGNNADGVDDWYRKFHTYSEIINKLKELAAQFKGRVEYVSGVASGQASGISVDGMRIVMCPNSVSTKPNMSFVVSGGAHAREWMGVAASMWLLNHVLQGNDTIASDLQKRFCSKKNLGHDYGGFNLYIVPVVNPDGYNYTLTKRNWRKNRRRNSDGSYGVDLNRNWDSHWCEVGGSLQKSSITYCGESAFSETESRGLSNFLAGLPNLAGYIDLHTYGPKILRPLGYTLDEAPDEARLKQWSEEMRDIIAGMDRGTQYKTMTAAELYPASGASDDWSYDELHVPSVLTIEINGVDFVVAESTIELEGPEVTAAVMHFIGRAFDYYAGGPFSSISSSSSTSTSNSNSTPTSTSTSTTSSWSPFASGANSVHHNCIFALVVLLVSFTMTPH